MPWLDERIIVRGPQGDFPDGGGRVGWIAEARAGRDGRGGWRGEARRNRGDSGDERKRHSGWREGPGPWGSARSGGGRRFGNDRGVQAAGNHTAIWNGTNAAGEDVASGVYFYRLKSGTFEETKKMVLLR